MSELKGRSAALGEAPRRTAPQGSRCAPSSMRGRCSEKGKQRTEEARLRLVLERAQGTPQPGDALGKPVFGRRKTPAHIAFALGAERRPGREPQSVLAHEALAEGETVAYAFNLEEGVHGSGRKGRFHPGDGSQLPDREIPRPQVTLQAFLNR